MERFQSIRIRVIVHRGGFHFSLADFCRRLATEAAEPSILERRNDVKALDF